MPGEPFEAAAVLDEMHGEPAFLLWCLLRDVDLAVTGDRTKETEMFAPGAERELHEWLRGATGIDDALREQMNLLARLAGDAAPALSEVSVACAAIAEWASGAGFGRTAYAAALRAAAASSRDPAYSYLAGIMARRIADYVRAEAWLKRTIALARHLEDGRHHALALLGLANLHIHRYELQPAIRGLQQTLGIARRFSLWDLRPSVYHDLFCIASMEGYTRKAAGYALAAARGYGRFHPRGLLLAHDVAHFLLRLDRAPMAFRVLQSLPLTRIRSAEQLLLLGSTGWAAGAAGESRVYREVWDVFWKRLDGVVEYDRAASALISLAWGAACLKDKTRLEVAAREALRIAKPRQEMLEAQQAEQLLNSLSEGVFPQLVSGESGTPDELRDAITAAELLLRDMLRWPNVTASETPSDRIPAARAGKPVHHQAQRGSSIRKLARRLPG